MREFCEWIIRALDARQFKLMPFRCDNEYNSWYVFLLGQKEDENNRQKLSHPFSLDWEFRINSVDKIIHTNYVVEGRQRLPQSFMDEHKITNPKFFSAQIKVNGKVVDTFDYVRNFCRYAVISNHSYHAGDSISVYVGNNETPVITDELDMSVPHLMYRNNAGKYELGNQIGRQESFLLIPEVWTIEGSHGLSVDSYELEGSTYAGIKIPANFEDEIVIKSHDGTLTFGSNVAQYWTELNSNPVYAPSISETLYNAGESHFSLCYDMENGVRTNHNAKVEYRNKWEDEWKAEPGYGEIFARAIDREGHFVTPVKFINIGNGVKVNVVSADENTCEIQVAWEHGRVTTDDDVKQVNDTWRVNKENISNNRIRFTLVPEDNSRNQFDISVKAPFKEFAIFDTTGNAIDSDCWIPYSDIDKFQYHLIGQDIREFSYGTHHRQLRWRNNKLNIEENGKNIKSIPYEGSLLSLFESREEIRQLLGRTSKNMLHAEVNVTILTQDGHDFSFAIKDSPYRPKQMADGKIVVTSKDKKVIDFRGTMNLLKLDDPFLEPEPLKYDEENGYVLPEKIRSWGKTLLVGQSRGRICPFLVDLTREMTGEDRWAERENGIQHIAEELKTSFLGDNLWQRIIGWFHRTQEDDIPASSLLELHCVAQDSRALICLAFQLFAQCDNEEGTDLLAEQMKSFSADLAFSWYWLIPQLKSTMNIIDGFVRDINNNVIRTIFIKWAMRKGEKAIEYLEMLNKEEEYAQNIYPCIMEVLSAFDKWMKKLCVDSLLDTYDNQSDEPTWAKDIVDSPNALNRIDDRETEYIDVNQDYINEETSDFFNHYPPGQRVSKNEEWLLKRVNAVAAHIKQDVDLFTQSGEIRRDIIFCCKSYNKQFIKSLHNKLAN